MKHWTILPSICFPRHRIISTVEKLRILSTADRCHVGVQKPATCTFSQHISCLTPVRVKDVSTTELFNYNSIHNLCSSRLQMPWDRLQERTRHRLQKLVSFHSCSTRSTQQVADIFPACGPVLTRCCLPQHSQGGALTLTHGRFPRLRTTPTPAYHNP